jgi:hypothetical protein
MQSEQPAVPSANPEIQVELTGNLISDSDVNAQDMQAAARIAITGTMVTGRGLLLAKGNTNCKILSVNDTIAGEAVSELVRSLPSLQILHAEGLDSCFEASVLPSSQQLRVINLIDVCITTSRDLDSTPLASMRDVVLRSVRVLDEDLNRILSAVPNLRSLDLRGTPIGRSTVSVIAASKTIEALFIDDPIAVRRLCDSMDKHQSLYSLTVPNSMAGDEAVSRFRSSNPAVRMFFD